MGPVATFLSALVTVCVRIGKELCFLNKKESIAFLARGEGDTKLGFGISHM
jgi:hypothetical protein